MFMRTILILLAIVGIGSFSVVAFDVTVMASSWYTTRGNVTCNKSVFKAECRMLDDKELWGQYKGLMAVKK